MSGAARVGGDFWRPENPALRVRGEFTAEVGEKPEARLDAGLVADPRASVSRTPAGDTAVTFSAIPAKSVEAFLPITLQGQLDTGDSVTLLKAQNYGSDGRFGPLPHYKADAAVIGAQVPGTGQLYSAVRFRVDHPYWLVHLAGGESSVVEDDGSTLSVETSEEGNWLVYESSAPATLGQLEIRVVSGCLVLVQLALYPDQDFVTRETQVRVEPDGPWLTVHGPAFCAEPDGMDPDTLLPPKVLTVKRFAKWIELHDRLDGLPRVVARPNSGDVHTRVLLLTPLFEGLHRRLPDYEKAKFPGVDKCVLRRVLKAGTIAAGAQADTEGLERKRVENAVTLFTEVSFRDRAEAVVAEVCSTVPEIAESVADLPRRITAARNELAHHLLIDDAEEPLAIRALRWLVITNVTSWLLRGLLLLRADIEPRVLRDRFLAHQRFAFFRANTAQHVRELGWELPSVQPAPADDG